MSNQEKTKPAMPEVYDFHGIEEHWQQVWADQNTFGAPDEDPRDKLYVLQMFPYPSGDLHAGHVRNYVIGDAVARYWRMQGYNVMHPMGFDSFGLPAEQAAIDRGVDPQDWIDQCVTNSRRQFKRYGFCFDWDREVITSQPDYYKWTQWLFLKFYEMGLIYRQEVEVNWCEEHGVLANDEVKDGACWRCEQPVAKKKLAQWLMETTKYAKRLLDGIDKLPGWTNAVRTMQRNWIGESHGTNIVFKVPAVESMVGQVAVPAEKAAQASRQGGTAPPLRPELTVFTTRVDTIFGCTFMAIAPDHPLAAAIAKAGGTSAELARFAAECARENVQYIVAEEKPKRGLRMGVDCVNPFNGEEIPIFSTNYVVSDFGTGAVMAVPAHDTRDFAFAKEYGCEIRQVIKPVGSRQGGTAPAADESQAGTPAPPDADECFTDKGICINSGEFDGMDFETAKSAMDKWLEERGLGGNTIEYKLRDWNMGRQRFWGAPIPMVHCEKCGWQPVPAKHLPVKLPEHADYSDIRVSPLANDKEWQKTECPGCSGPAARDTDTMTTFMCSAWYFLRFCDPHNAHAPFSAEKVQAWMPVDYYVGGKEHAVGHLLYSRFVTMALSDAGLLNLSRQDHEGKLPEITDEPFRRLFNQGIVYKDGAKMSKSKGNVVSADELADHYGADTARLFAFFGGPADQDLEWSTAGVEGCHRFLKRVWRFARAVAQAEPGSPDHCDESCAQAVKLRHKAVAGVSDDIAGWRFNTAIAKLMEYLNGLEAAWSHDDGRDDCRAFALAMLVMAQLLSPFAPHFAEELWSQLGGEGLCCDSDWPVFDPDALTESTLELPVQVNGKLRGKISVAADAAQDAVLAAARTDEKVAPWLEGKQLIKEIYVPGRMVTLVVK